ncbi:unnamed protein product [Ectocarpus sp. 12 AP-2014]
MSPPAPPARQKPRTNAVALPGQPLLLIATDENVGIVTYSSNHPLLSEVAGFYGDGDINLFFTDELYDRVLAEVGGNDGSSPTDRLLMFVDEIEELKKASLLRLFSEELYGGSRAVPGQVFRGTIVL